MYSTHFWPVNSIVIKEHRFIVARMSVPAGHIARAILSLCLLNTLPYMSRSSSYRGIDVMTDIFTNQAWPNWMQQLHDYMDKVHNIRYTTRPRGLPDKTKTSYRPDLSGGCQPGSPGSEPAGQGHQSSTRDQHGRSHRRRTWLGDRS